MKNAYEKSLEISRRLAPSFSSPEKVLSLFLSLSLSPFSLSLSPLSLLSLCFVSLIFLPCFLIPYLSYFFYATSSLSLSWSADFPVLSDSIPDPFLRLYLVGYRACFPNYVFMPLFLDHYLELILPHRQGS